MQRFDALFPGRKISLKKGTLVLPETSAHRQKSSPHVISMAGKDDARLVPLLSVERSGKTLDFDPLPVSWKRPAPRQRHHTFWREIKRMAALGTVVVLLIFANSTWGKVRSFENDTLRQEQEKLETEAHELTGKLHDRDTAEQQTAIVDFLKTITASALYIKNYAQTTPPTVLPVESGFQSSTALLEAGKLLGESGAIVLQKKSDLEKILPPALSGQTDLLALLQDISSTVQLLLPKFERAEMLLSNALAGPLPENIRTKIAPLVPLLQTVQTKLQEFLDITPQLATLLGKNGTHKILFLLENKNELRATGGFLGNVLMVTLDHGRIESTEFHDIFDYSGQFPEVLPAPPQFAHLTGGWFPHDCNIFPDFKTSAEKCRWFLEQAKAPSADTIIAIHNGILEDLLGLTGPIDLPEKPEVELNSQNVSFVLSYVIEAKIFGQGGTNSPKKFLSGLLPLLVKNLEKANPAALVTLMEEWRTSKTVQMYSADAELEKLWQKLKLDGSFLPADPASDFLGITNENVGGNKSDAFMVQHIQEESLLNLNGELLQTVSITREHTWNQQAVAEFEKLFGLFGSPHVAKADMERIMGAGTNKVFTTVYFPKGTRLLTSKNFPIHLLEKKELENTTAFSFFFPEVKAGDSANVEFTVMEPQRIGFSPGTIIPFTALVQAGAGPQFFSKSFLAEAGLQVQGSELIDLPFVQNLSTAYLVTKQ